MAFHNDEAAPEAGRVFGMFTDSEDAIAAIRALQAAGFDASRIGIAMQDRAVQAEIIDATGSEAAEGAKTGAVGLRRPGRLEPAGAVLVQVEAHGREPVA